MLKRLLAAALAVLLMLSITISAFAADSPLAASDRITAQLTDIQKRREEIEKTLSQRETAKKVATFRGKNMTESQGLNYFINRKIMTKRDFEAFKWSFIFSQFAVPLEDSLLDVLSDEVVNKMINDNFTITGVKEFIITGSSDNEENNVTNEVSMLQDVNVPELVETIKENYAVYPIFKENGSQPTLGDILNPAPLSIFEKFYLKDTLAAQTPREMSKDNANALFYNQDLLENFKSEIVFEDVDIPIFVYDANSYMYLQIGIGAYLKANGNKSISDLIAARGEEALCIDSFGNICSKSANGSATILLPNFGNSFLNARETSNNLLEESINLYNKWFVTLYTRQPRNINTVYPETPEIIYADTVAPVTNASGGRNLMGNGKAVSHYANYLTVNTGNDLSNTLLLVETGAASMRPADLVMESYEKLMTLNDGEHTSWSIGKRVRYSHYLDADVVNQRHYVDLVGSGDQNYLKSCNNVGVNIVNSILYTIKQHPTMLSADSDTNKSQEDSFKDMLGLYRSPYNYNINRYAPFVASHLTAADTAALDLYTLLQPIVNVGVDIFRTNVSDSTNNHAEFTHFYYFSNSLQNGHWKFNGSTINPSTRANSGSAREGSAVIGTDDVLTLVTTFKSDQVLDNRFASGIPNLGEGVSNSDIYLPKDIVDVGQNMEAYINDEKGMFLAAYKLYYSGYFSDFCKSEIANSNNFLRRNVAKFYDRAANSNIYFEDKLGNELTDTDLETTDKCSIIQIHQQDGGSYNVTLNQWNDSVSRTEDFQRLVYYPWTFTLTKNTFSQDNLKKIYNFQEQWKRDSNEGSGHEKEPVHPVKKTNIYIRIPLDDKGERIYKNSEVTTTQGNEKDADYDGPYTYYYIADAVVSHTIPGENGSYTDIASTKDIVDYIKSKFKRTSSDYTSPNDIMKMDAWSFDPTTVALSNDVWQRFLQPRRLAYMAVYFADLITQAVRTWEYGGYKDNITNYGYDFTDLIEEISELFQIDSYELLVTYMCLFSALNPDENHNNMPNRYFYDEYQYFLRNPTYLSNALGYKTSNGDPTANDFATITYFWDRHYLLQSAFNSQVMKEVEADWKGVKNQSPASMSSIYEAYIKDIEQNHFGIANQSLQDFVLSQKIDLLGIQVEGKTIYTPYFYEWAIQDRNQNPNASVSEQLENINSSQENTTETNGQTSETEDTKISAIFGSTSAFYNYLDADTIILYPFSRMSGEITSSSLTAKAGLGDAVLSYALDAADMRNDNKVKTDLVATILALQCNTDYKHNNLSVAAAKPAEKTHVTKEELMDNANQFFTNPVTSISYIFTGFLYQVHAVIATGNIGSVFSINWLLESDVYKWVMNRYVALLAIAVGVILLLKLIQFAMNKSRDAMAIGRSIAGILAMCLVPVIIFNSFVWVFDTSSKWFMHGSLDKILLSQIDIKERERINSDPGATAELNAFKEQFNALDLNGSECLLFEEMTGYSLENGPIYKTVGIWDYMNNVIYTADNKGDWYTSKAFKSIHKSRYKESVFYYFYDFIRAEYFNYCSTVGTGGNTAIIKEYVREMEEHEASAQSSSGNAQLEAIKDINTSEQSIAMLTGGFRTMLEDTTYVYGDTLLEGNKHITNGPKVKDLVGLYKIFNSAETDADVGEILKSVYYTAWENSSTMKATDSVVPKTWKDAAYLDEYFSSKTNSKLQRGQASYNGMPVGKYYIITSYLDLFNKAYNNMDMTGLTINDIAITPLEEKLCALSDDIYNTTLKALNYLPDKIHDESAITLMAMIATCKLNEAFGVAPAEPVLESVTLDSFVRTAFLTDLEMVGSNVNTLYAMIAQGDSIGKVLVVVFLELIICVASVARILIILYITGASFVILGLRLLHKAPRTTDLVYGIVGNMLMLLALHAITLFLVIIAVEAVAGAVSVVPSILLDILMIVFTIMMAVTLFKLVKNIAKDAVNIGGAKIKGIVHSIGDTVANAIKSVTHSKDNEINAANVTINSQTTSETPAIISEALVERRREHVNTIVQNIKQVEEEESAEAAESANTQQASQVEKNLQAEREVEDS